MDASLKHWLRTIPVSQMVYPAGFPDRMKYCLWYVLRPLHPYARNFLAHIGYMRKYEKYRPDGRQRFLLGTLAPDVTPRTLVEHLVSKGYGRQLVALLDRGEVISLRYSPTFKHQYHIRLFEDGEVRGHYEYTVEAHPFWHDKEIGFENHHEYFLKLLDGLIVPAAAS
ncbi:MAG TPA: hypothetical protein VHD55_03080 [Candidatus Paceibacterota bacterium]|nr:hypothetical protein [Candidatus Paceibacterota bacterium]